MLLSPLGRPLESDEPTLLAASPLRLVISVNALNVLAFGLFPGALLRWYPAALTGGWLTRPFPSRLASDPRAAHE